MEKNLLQEWPIQNNLWAAFGKIAEFMTKIPNNIFKKSLNFDLNLKREIYF
jgi:hypothetical protein